MIIGIGTDLVEIARFESLLARHGERAGRRILAPDEHEEWVKAALPARFLAKRFAAKEAFAKAVGTGVREPVLLTAIRIGHDALGKPELAFSPTLAGWLAARGVLRTHLSVSDERSLCSAFVVLEG